ncbi:MULTISPECIES: GNAT family N-acetyltransferase [unclassified Paludibacterium]|uniref:GNAT family N-acetyltransferase n=1 Tax=unclassified Paludibacterium TaxID=2618429 RepID=UPI001C040A69|nr:GNAT family N-acetyltransferase [Paludibacterium sp. B53371]BEV72752.1 GNAT family N-acetyltransferase [Paludibacterium sp. THUN1379]
MASLLNWQCHRFNDFSLEGLYAMLRLRDQVFVLEQQSIYGDLDNLDQPAWHVCGHDARGQLLAYARLLAPGDKYEHAVAITRVVVDPSLRGQGVGRQLLAESLRQAEQRFPTVMQKLSAQVSALAFYESFGFVVASAPYDDGGIMHCDMTRAVH